MKTINVTQKDIEQQPGNPILRAIDRHLDVRYHSVSIQGSGLMFGILVNNRCVNMLQWSGEIGIFDGILQPFSFKLDIPKEYLRR